MAQTYPVGQAPWEKSSYAVGSAPWEQSAPQQPQQSLSDRIWSTLAATPKAITNTLGLGPASDVIATNINNVVHPKLMQATNAPLTSLEQNIGAGAQLGGTLASVAASPASLPAITATGAGLGAVTQAGQAMTQNKSAGNVVASGATGGVVQGALSGALALAGKALSAFGKETYKFVVPKSTREAQMLQTYKANTPLFTRVKNALEGTPSGPRTAGDTAFEQGLVGTESMIGVQAKRASDSIWGDLIQPKLDRAPDQIDMPSFFNHIQEQIIKSTPERSRQAALLEALDAMRQDYAGVQNVSLADLQKFKEGWAQFVPDKAYQGKPIGAAFREVQNEAANAARSAIYKSLGKDIRTAYVDYGNLKAIQALGQKAMTGGKLKGGAGSFISAIRDMALTPIGTAGGLTVYHAGNGIELLGKKGANVVSDIISPKILEFLQSSQSPTGDQAQ